MIIYIIRVSHMDAIRVIIISFAAAVHSSSHDYIMPTSLKPRVWDKRCCILRDFLWALSSFFGSKFYSSISTETRDHPWASSVLWLILTAHGVSTGNIVTWQSHYPILKCSIYSRTLWHRETLILPAKGSSLLQGIEDKYFSFWVHDCHTTDSPELLGLLSYWPK